MPDIRFVVYDPPQDGYPFLAVALSCARGQGREHKKSVAQQRNHQ